MFFTYSLNVSSGKLVSSIAISPSASPCGSTVFIVSFTPVNSSASVYTTGNAKFVNGVTFVTQTARTTEIILVFNLISFSTTYKILL